MYERLSTFSKSYALSKNGSNVRISLQTTVAGIIIKNVYDEIGEYEY